MIADFETPRHRFLSNFYLVNIRFEGMVYPSVEHAYQAAKTELEFVRRRIRDASTPGLAKRMGRRLVVNVVRWDERKDAIMLQLLREKFSVTRLRLLLLNTGEEELVEGNTWGDVYWGVCRGRGENKLGVLLMQVRGELRNRLLKK